MLKDILKAFQAKITPALTPQDARIALAALMVRIARTDGDYAQVEIAMIDRVLQNHFNLDAAHAKALRIEAEEVETHAPDTVRFTRVIKDAIPYEERTAVIEALWAVVLADGHRDADENGFMRLVANLLGVNDRDSAFARQHAQKEIG